MHNHSYSSAGLVHARMHTHTQLKSFKLNLNFPPFEIHKKRYFP